MLLVASSYHVAAALHSQPLEIPVLRDFIRSHLSGRAYPQMVPGRRNRRAQGRAEPVTA